MARVHKNIRIKGRVQGVFFRASAQRKAQDMQLAGFVRNEPDGSVYIESEGNDLDVKQFIEWCKEGPPAAKVTAVEVIDGAVRHFKDFQIARR